MRSSLLCPTAESLSVSHQIDEIDWDNSDVPHAFEHGFDAGDIEEILLSSEWIPSVQKDADGVLCYHGQTDAGRYG